ncbi:hypothetical protein VaNZ11_012212 [Volvox africanus]|uniref:Calponin-homology (CH) domain-containing protein n=1 Tax=Volvox africanus TaxID=51714 RepID=A0ABQ5SEN5_9CHLO|nr:hypothetical protein VaNZ11_012212 [Volvox africanus]
MSILLALLRSPRISGPSRNPRAKTTQEFYTEMGVFNRCTTEGTELNELPAVAFPAPLASKDSAPTASNSLANELAGDESPLSLDFSYRASAAAEITFTYGCLNPGGCFVTDECVQEVFERLCWSGSILCNLLCSALPGSLDERAINTTDRGFGNLTPDEVLENFQLCYNCAHAQGCDVQELTVGRLCACEVSCLADFVLEVLRLSVVQVLPAADRQVILRPQFQAVGPATAGGAASQHKGRLAVTSLLPVGTHRQLPCGDCAPDLPIGDISSRSNSSSSGCADVSGNCDHRAGTDVLERCGLNSVTASPIGTAAARRAMAGLEYWALELVHTQPGGTALASPSLAGTSSPATPPPAPCGLGTSPAAHGPPLQLSPAERVTNPAAFSTIKVVSSHNDKWGTEVGWGPSSSGQSIEDGDRTYGAQVGAGTDSTIAATASNPVATDPAVTNEPDPLGLEIWEHLAALLSRPLACSAVPRDRTTFEHAQEMLKQGSPYSATSGDFSEGTPQPTIPTGLQVTVPRDATDDEEARWAAAAELLSKALGAAPNYGPPLPTLRVQHLQRRHPGLRALILARALLVHCRQRDRLLVELTPSRTNETAHGSNISNNSSSGSIYPTSTADVTPGSAAGKGAEQGSAAAVAAASVIAAAAAAAPKMLPASPAPPLPPRRESALPVSSKAVSRRQHSTGGHAPMDLLSEHNLLVQREHHQRELRRLQKQQQLSTSGGGNAGGDRPHATATETVKGVLWSGDGDDEEGTDQEERVLRLWLNSLDQSIHVTSLFEQEITTGWPLLIALEAIQPGCVPWSDAFRPPFKEKLRKILSVQNCNLVIDVCTRQLAMPPLVNIGGLDLALGQRRATLSLVFQMMRHHMGMLLGLAAPHPIPSPRCTSATAVATTAQQQPGCGLAHNYNLGYGFSRSYSLSCGFSHDTAPQLAQHVPYAPSSQRGSRAHVEVEKAVLAWANAKLQEAALTAGAAAAAAASNDAAEVTSAAVAWPGGVAAPQLPFTPLASFSDKRLAAGRLLLQLLAAICPRSVNPKYVLPGRDDEERGSNARYLLSCARKLGCVIFLGWEDVVAARPNLLLLLLASFMALDRKRASNAADAALATTTAIAVTGGTVVGLPTSLAPVLP